jgi:trimeric autotransporter adhesin
MLVSLVILGGMLTTHFVVAQGSAGESESSALQSLLQVASSARAYAQGAVELASSSGLGVSPETALVASGNASLLAAEAALNPGGNLVTGLEDAHDAMGNFTAAAAGAGASLQGAGLTPSAEVMADLATVASLNDSAMLLSSVIDETCASTTVGGSLESGFLADCATAKSWLVNATAQLGTASTLLAAVEAGAPGSSVSGFAGIVSQARTDVSGADSELLTLAPFTYAARAEAYADGPLASQLAAANASASLQGKLADWFGRDVSAYQNFSVSQSSAVEGMTSAASTLASAISSVSMTSVTTSIAAQQTTLASALSNMTSFSQLLTSLPLPSSIISGLLANASTAEGSLNTYDSALSNLSASAGSFQSVTVGAFSSYIPTFYALDNTEETDAAAFASSLSTLQVQVGTIANLFPLIAALATWASTFAQIATNINTGGTQVTASLAAAYSSTQSVSSGAASLTTAVRGAPQALASSALLQNVSSVYSSESGLLNSTALASVSSASSALQSDWQLASEFVITSQSLLEATMGGFAGAPHTLAAQASSLSAETQSASSSMSSASAYLTADLDARTATVASATSLIAQANTAFGALQVAQGAALLARASATLAATSGD